MPPPPAPLPPPRPAAAGSSGPAVRITGNEWTPNVDGAGNIQVSDFEQLPLNRWLYVRTNTLDDVVPRPRYPTFLGHPDGSRSIVDAWCGAAYDYETQRMLMSGGGHADSHFCENGVYELAADTMRFGVVVPRSAPEAAQWWNARTGTNVPGMNGSGGGSPLADGSIPATHTFDSLVWIPPAVAGNSRGALLMFADAVGVIDLDTRRYDIPHFTGYSPVDLSYKICVMDGWNLLHARASWFYRRWDLRPSTRTTNLSGQSGRGAFINQFSAGTNVVYNHKMMVRLPQRREFVVMSANGVIRCRYGAAFDSGAVDHWGSFHDSVTLNSADGSHADFARSADWRDQEPETPLFAAGGTYDYWGDCIWVQTNLAGGALYKLTGLATNTWTVQRVAGAVALSTSRNGTYHRVQVFTKGTARCLMRVSSTTGLPEVCRVA